MCPLSQLHVLIPSDKVCVLVCVCVGGGGYHMGYCWKRVMVKKVHGDT